MKPFILVFSEDACMWMITHGFNLIKADIEQGFWLFASKDGFDEAELPFHFAYSDILTF